MKICKVKNCSNKYYGKGYCKIHYLQLYRNGKILNRTPYDSNEIIDCGDYYEVCIYSGKSEQKEVARTKIDKEDLEKVKNYKWYLNGTGYVVSNNKISNDKNIIIFLHHIILSKKVGFMIDHLNHDILDNRKQNLRYATRSQNIMNQKSSRGYSWYKKNKKWVAYIQKDNKKIHLGYFTNEQDAINARHQAELKYFGEFAPTRI